MKSSLSYLSQGWIYLMTSSLMTCQTCQRTFSMHWTMQMSQRKKGQKRKERRKKEKRKGKENKWERKKKEKKRTRWWWRWWWRSKAGSIQQPDTWQGAWNWKRKSKRKGKRWKVHFRLQRSRGQKEEGSRYTKGRKRVGWAEKHGGANLGTAWRSTAKKHDCENGSMVTELSCQCLFDGDGQRPDLKSCFFDWNSSFICSFFHFHYH